jgi:hypothetical protein
MITIHSTAARRSILRCVSLLICVGLLAAAPGCSKSAKPKAAAEPAGEAEKEEAPAAPQVEKKPEAKPAPAPVVHHVPPDPTKWQLVDLQAGLTTHDMRFMPAVLIFSIQSGNGAKQADDLKGLLERAGQMKDDPSIALPLPPAPNATPVTAAKPVVPGQPATPPANPAAPVRRGRRMGGYRGAGAGN